MNHLSKLTQVLLLVYVLAVAAWTAYAIENLTNTVIDCIYDDQRSLATCEMPAGTRVIPIDWADETFSEWLWQTQLRGGEVDYNLPLVKVRPVRGAILKAELQEDGEWSALADCHVRVHRRLQDRAKWRPGEIPSFTLLEMPADCQKKRD